MLYLQGRFTAHEAAEAAGALRYYAIGLGGYAALKVLVNAFYAIDRRKTPMFVSFAAVALNLLLNLLFTFHLGWGHRGLAFSTGCVATCNFLLLYLLMRSHLGGLKSRRLLVLLGQSALAAGALIGVCAVARTFWLADWAVQPFLPKLAALLVTVVGAAAAYFVCGLALGIAELRELAAAIRARLR